MGRGLQRRYVSTWLHSDHPPSPVPVRLSQCHVPRRRVRFQRAMSGGGLNYQTSRHHTASPSNMTLGRLEPPCGPPVGREDTWRGQDVFQGPSLGRGGESTAMLSLFRSDFSSTPSKWLPFSAEFLQRILISNAREREIEKRGPCLLKRGGVYIFLPKNLEPSQQKSAALLIPYVLHQIVLSHKFSPGCFLMFRIYIAWSLS